MKYIISIPEPCNENWENMTATEQGRFCTVCTKEVFDMTTLSNRALVNKLKNNENICGRYKASQLDIDLYANSNTGLSRFGLLFSLTSLFAISQPALAQQNTTKTAIQNKDAKLKTPLETNDILSDSITLRGTVSDNIYEVAGVSVLLKGTNIDTFTDFDGNFALNIPKEQQKVILVFSSPAYDTQEVIITDFTKKITVLLEEESELMGEIVIVEHPSFLRRTLRKITKPIANLFRKKENKR